MLVEMNYPKYQITKKNVWPKNDHTKYFNRSQVLVRGRVLNFWIDLESVEVTSTGERDRQIAAT